MASVMAIRENTTLAPDTPTDLIGLRKLLERFPDEIRTIRSINQAGIILPDVREEIKNAYYFLLVLNSKERKTAIAGFPKVDHKKATDEYLQLERDNADNPFIDVVLVSADTIDMLERSYVNYFADMRVFAQAVEETLRVNIS